MRTCTYNIQRLVINARPHVVLPLEETSEELHLQVLRDAVRRYASKPRLLPLVLAHALPRAFMLAHALIRLVSEQLFFVLLRLKRERFRLRRGGQHYELLRGLGRSLGLCPSHSGIRQSHPRDGGPPG